jgi:hypothetical protein
MADEKKTLKFQMMMSPAEAKVLDDWMFTNRIRSRAEAIRRLTQIALAVEPLADDFLHLWGEIGKADGKIGESILEAWANISGATTEDVIRAFSKAHDSLTSPALELGLQASKLKAVFDALKAGEDVEETLRKVEDENKSIDRTRDWVRNSFGKKRGKD